MRIFLFNKISFQQDGLSSRLPCKKNCLSRRLPFEKVCPLRRDCFLRRLPFKKIDCLSRRFPTLQFTPIIISLPLLLKVDSTYFLKITLGLLAGMATRENDSMVWQHTWNFFSSQKTENALSINVMITLLPTTSWAYTFFSAVEENESYFCGKNCNKTELLLKPLQNKKGQKNLGYQKKMQSFSL